jgi:hypothetical protein
VARNLSRKFFAGEHYVLAVDSHSRFACAWDDKLVALHLRLNHTRAILTAYPPDYHPLTPPQALYTPSRLAAKGFDALDGTLRLRSLDVPWEHCGGGGGGGGGGGAVASLFWAAGYNFGRSLSVHLVPYDARLVDVFWGEEALVVQALWAAACSRMPYADV